MALLETQAVVSARRTHWSSGGELAISQNHLGRAGGPRRLVQVSRFFQEILRASLRPLEQQVAGLLTDPQAGQWFHDGENGGITDGLSRRAADDDRITTGIRQRNTVER